MAVILLGRVLIQEIDLLHIELFIFLLLLLDQLVLEFNNFFVIVRSYTILFKHALLYVVKGNHQLYLSLK